MSIVEAQMFSKRDSDCFVQPLTGIINDSFPAKLYMAEASLVWNGNPVKGNTSIQKFYEELLIDISTPGEGGTKLSIIWYEQCRNILEYLTHYPPFT